ncbi:MAG: phage tail sheath subtilisin-like domain-containing protein [Nitrospirota bacterium]|nr:phage tail sheath subtilisin-like domain-containing protein [Nitrospirota bacterium]
MAISFNGIPVSTRVPGVYAEFDASRAARGLAPEQQRILVLGQRLTTGSVAAGVPTMVNSAAEAEAYFGRGSMLARMFAALKGANRYTESWAIALDDNGAGVAATGTLTVTATTPKAGTIALYVGGVRLTIGVATTDTATTIATAIAAAITAETSLPVTATSTLGVVTVTARHKGELGNDIDLRVNYQQGEQLPSGVTVVVAAMASGVTNPTLTAAIAAMGEVQYHYIISPYTDATSLTAAEAELLDRFGPLRANSGVLYTAKKGIVSALSAFGSGRNSHLVSCIDAGNAPQTTEIWAAVYGGVAAFNLATDPARPLRTLTLTGLMAPAESARRTWNERNTLLFDGISTTTVVVGTVQIERSITMYQINAAAAPDTSYLDVTTPHTLFAVRYQFRTRMGLRFPRHKLASDGVPASPGQAIATPASIRAEIVALFYELEAAGLIEGMDQFKSNLIVERNAGDPNRVDVLMAPDLVNGLQVLAAQIQFLL